MPQSYQRVVGESGLCIYNRLVSAPGSRKRDWNRLSWAVVNPSIEDVQALAMR